ncbi:phage tail protein [Novosphingobium colocasiae]
MTTIVFSTVGSMVGGPIGGAIGALVGRQVDGALLGIPNRQGPRLRELGVTTSTYGEVLPRHYGRMRVAGSVIWATDLVEHSDTEGGGKGSPSLTTYTYSASFAVALASRPILSVGRIWADGRLLRGAAGDLKVGGALRIHTGRGDQPADPLLAADAGADRCPAYRGLAYAVFEDLDLSEFYNRVPNLTFEVIADEAFDLGTLVGDVLDDADAAAALDGVAGWSCEGSLAEALDMLDAVVPMEAYAAGDRLIIKPARLQTEAVALPEPALNVTDDGFGGQSGFARRRDPVIVQPPMALRYYDTARDYLPGLQRATGRPIVGKPRTLELPAALDPVAARALIERTLRRGDWSRDRVSWRTADLDTRIGPGTVASLPGIAGLWRVIAWEWRDGGVELALARVFFPRPVAWMQRPGRAMPASSTRRPTMPPGRQCWRLSRCPDWCRPLPERARAYLPPLRPPSPYWAGAALYADPGTGAMLPLGPSGRNRCMIGTMLDVLPVASPHIVDRASSVTVQLVGEDLALSDMSLAQLALGGNLALIGDEAIQFGRAIPLGGRASGVWRCCCAAGAGRRRRSGGMALRNGLS